MSENFKNWVSVDEQPDYGETVLCGFMGQFGKGVYFVAVYHGGPYGFVPINGHYAKPTHWIKFPLLQVTE